MSKSTVTAAQVRAYFNDGDKGAARLAALPEGARKSVAPGARGRIAPEAVKAFNAKRKQDRRYVVGTQRAALLEAQAANLAKREALRQAGVEVKARGRLPKAVVATAKP